MWKFRAKRSADVCAAVSTVGAWASIGFTCWVLGGPAEAPMVAGTITTIVIWALRRIEQ